MPDVTITIDLTPENFPTVCQLLSKLSGSTEGLSFAGEEAPEKSAASEPAKKSTAKKETAKPEPEAPAAEPKAGNPSKTDVRAVALKLSKAGKSDIIKEIFEKYGAEKLSDVAEEDYAALMQDLVAVDG